jgi:anion-transporting  ArsA/GET3 family ATPase
MNPSPEKSLARFLETPTRFVFFTGKGGVGKTSFACATAIALADRGKQVLVVSTDPASNLGEVLGQRLDGVPTPIPGVDNLRALNIDPEARIGFDHVIFDTAPTGHTLRLMKLPTTRLLISGKSAKSSQSAPRSSVGFPRSRSGLRNCVNFLTPELQQQGDHYEQCQCCPGSPSRSADT